MMSNKKFQWLVFAVVLMGLIQSCTIEKRRYMDGYHVHRFSKPTKVDSVEECRAEESDFTVTQPNVAQSIVEIQDSILPEEIALNTALTADALPKYKQAPKEKSPRAQVRFAPVEQVSTWGQRWVGAFSANEEGADGSGWRLATYLAFALLIALLIITLVSSGWNALGYLILFLLSGILLFIISLLALLIHNRNGWQIPWTLYALFVLGLIISGAFIYALLGG